MAGKEFPMSKTLIVILLAIATLFVLSILVDNRIAAGGGALVLLGGLIYGYVRNKGASRRDTERAEAGARDLRREIEEDEARRNAE
jgi:hypothetical protein